MTIFISSTGRVHTYATLQADVATYLHRSDLSDVMPSLVARAEASLFRELQIKGEEVSVSDVTVGGYALLPADFGAVSKLAITYAGSTRLLDYSNLAVIPSSADPAPSKYRLENGKLRIYGTSDGQAYTLYYLPTIAPLSDSNTSNWLLDNAADLYLYAVALEGAKHIRDDGETQKLAAMVPPLLDSVRRLAERKGQPINGGLQIKPRR